MSDPLEERIRRFEFYMRCRVIGIAEILAQHFDQGVGPLSEAGYFILSGISSYFEAINQFLTGEGSERKSNRYFREGFRHVYPSTPLSDSEIDAIYSWLRCGMYHSAMPMGDTYLNRHFHQAIHKDVSGMVINPAQLVHDIQAHFNRYMAALKNPACGVLRTNFNKRAEEIESSLVGMIAVSGTAPSGTVISTSGTPPPFLSGPPIPPHWGS